MEEKEKAQLKQDKLIRPEENQFSYSVDEMINYDGVKLFTALRLMENISERRELTTLIHKKKLLQWRQNENFNHSIARHLVDDVHSSFRRNFTRVLNTSPLPNINIRLFNSINSSLHGHHSTEDEYWFPRLNRSHPEISGILFNISL
jgi:hypothetical protein